MLVDTGVTFSVLPASFLADLGLSPTEEQQFTLPDGSTREYGVGEARFRIAEVELTTPVVFGEERAFRLGRVTLAVFALVPDTTHQRFVEQTPLPMVGTCAVGIDA